MGGACWLSIGWRAGCGAPQGRLRMVQLPGIGQSATAACLAGGERQELVVPGPNADAAPQNLPHPRGTGKGGCGSSRQQLLCLLAAIKWMSAHNSTALEPPPASRAHLAYSAVAAVAPELCTLLPSSSAKVTRMKRGVYCTVQQQATGGGRGRWQQVGYCCPRLVQDRGS